MSDTVVSLLSTPILCFNPANRKKNKLHSIQTKIEKTVDMDVFPKEILGESEAQYNAVVNALLILTKHHNFCKGILDEYIETALTESDAILVLEDYKKNKKRIVGMCAISFKKDHLYVDLICSNQKVKGVGSLLLELVEVLSNTLSLEHMKLSSVTDAVPFYLKKKFECDKLCHMTRKVTKKRGVTLPGGVKKTKIRNTRRQLSLK